MIRFGIVGAGWRSEFYIRIAQALPEKFEITGMYIRSVQSAAKFAEKYDVKIMHTLDDLLSSRPDFVVSCVNKGSICDEIEVLCNKGIAVLSETPIGTSLQQIKDFEGSVKPEWKVQVAEQFHFQPRNQAIKAVIDSGILGQVHQVQLSCCHDYHAVSLIRYFLNIANKLPEVKSIALPDTVVRYNGRNGITEPTEITSQQKISVMMYPNQTAIYDFNMEQYFSDIRNSRIVIRGTKGEIINDTVTYLDGTTPMKFDLIRNYCGTNESLDGMYLDAITGNGKILYRNPFRGARLTDEEIAIACCLIKMGEYIESGISFYDIKDAATDSKTALLF